MTKKNKILLLALAAMLVIALCLGVASCSGGEGSKADPETPAPSVGTEKLTYTLVLKTEGGKALEGVGVYFYTDSTMAELVWFAKTDAEGKVGFTDLESNGYVAVLDNPPEGYKVDPYYPLTDEVTEVVLTTDMADGDLANLTYKLGDVMMNFSITDADGNTWVLSDLLAEKQAVVLNFWYLQCAPCRAEFPYLQEAYEKYSDKIALLALNPINEDNEAIKAFAEELGLTFPMAHCDPNWEKAMQLTAYPTTVIIDRFGTIALIHKGSIDESKVFADAFEFFTEDSYKQTTVEDIMDLEIKAEGADSSNPIEIGSKTSFDVTLDAGQRVYYHIYRVDGMTLSVSNTNIAAEYNGTTYSSGSGLNFTVRCADTYTPAAVTFINEGEEPQTFTVRLSAKPGTVDNPNVLKKTGDFSVKVESGNSVGVYYTYTPKEDGLLTVQCTGITPKNVRYGISLTTQKGNATVQRNLEEDGDTETGTVSISVKKGVKVQITVSTLPDDTKSYPAASLKCTLSMGEDTTVDEDSTGRITYAVTVTDQDMIPLSGVFMNVKKTGAEASDNTVRLSTNEAGVAYTTQEAGDYDVVLTLPVGYTADTTAFRLTEARPYAAVKLTEAVAELKTYTVTVTDIQGNPLAGADVFFANSGRDAVTTDETGIVTMELQKAVYTVYVTPPTGYAADNNGYTFAEDSTELIIALEEGTGDDPGDTGEMLEYTITVVDYSGKAQSGVTVYAMKGAAMAGSAKTGSDGTVKLSLAAGDYTVTLSGTKLYYEEKLAVLSADNTNLTIRLAPGVSGTPQSLYVGAAYYIYVGGNYVQMQANAVNYYIFEPEEPGLYQFATSDPDAIISYWGGNTSFINDMTSSTDYDPATNTFTRNWKKGNLGGLLIIGVTGAEDCIIEVTRISDPILDETDLVPEVYEPQNPPKKFTINKAQGRRLKYVDMTAATEDFQIVMGSDGYYHLNSATGPILYINIGPNAPYHSLYYMAGAGGNGVAGNGIKATIYDEDGKAVKRIDFSEAMLEFGECADATYGIYPLTEDLRYIVQTAGKYYGWWDSESSNFWLDSVNGLNSELGWMFAVCYVP